MHSTVIVGQSHDALATSLEMSVDTCRACICYMYAALHPALQVTTASNDFTLHRRPFLSLRVVALLLLALLTTATNACAPAGTALQTRQTFGRLSKQSNMARVYADVNQHMPRTYWDYDSVNISWGVLESYEVVRKIGAFCLFDSARL